MYLKKIKAKGQLSFELEFNQKNIILGENSTGKSTLINLIIYSLGSRVDDFIEEIREGKVKQVELDIECKSGNTYRLIRALPHSDIITVTPYNDTDELMEEEVELLTLNEFSDFILKEEGYTIQNISYGTQHASLRLYFLLRAVLVDQNTPAASILANIGGSNSGFLNNQKLIKKAIIEELLGTENNSIQKKRFELQQKIKERKEINSKYKSVKEIIQSQLEKNNELEEDQENIEKQIKLLEIEKQEITQAEAEHLLILKNLIAEEKQNDLITFKEERNHLNSSIRRFRLDLLDIESVMKKLNEEVKELKRKIAARQFITQIPVNQCPACLSQLTLHNQEGNCPLCNQEIDNTELENTLRYKKMLEESISESVLLQKDLQQELNELLKQKDEKDEMIREIEEKQIKELRDKKGPVEEIIQSVKYRYQEIIQKYELLKNFNNTLDYEKSLKAEKNELDTSVKELREELTKLEQNKSVSDINKVEEWERLFKETLEEVFGDVDTVQLDDNYLPLVNSKEVQKLSSASLKVATRLSYVLSLFMLNSIEKVSLNHLGFVIFDSPRDKDLDQEKYKKFLDKINVINTGQIILTGSIEDSAYSNVFSEKDIPLKLYEEEKLLK